LGAFSLGCGKWAKVDNYGKVKGSSIIENNADNLLELFGLCLLICLEVLRGVVSWISALQYGGVQACGACCGHVGAVCQKHCNAYLTYPCMDRLTVLFS